jgi:hypothetical protein
MEQVPIFETKYDSEQSPLQTKIPTIILQKYNIDPVEANKDTIS